MARPTLHFPLTPIYPQIVLPINEMTKTKDCKGKKSARNGAASLALIEKVDRGLADDICRCLERTAKEIQRRSRKSRTKPS